VDITAVNRSMNASVAVTPAVPVEKAAENREIVRAVKALNGTEMFGHDNQLVFERDQQSHRMVLRVINRNTHEVVSQFPAEVLLRLADDLKPQPADSTPARFGSGQGQPGAGR
jgi:flagellar protein FlaG